MSPDNYEIPVTLIIFNRPDKVKRSIDAIRQVRPQQLFVIADGPRSDRPEEAARCSASRAIIETVDWDCKVVKNYAEQNLGCANRIVSGINWIFEQVDKAIILEDDCIPNASFFKYCQELLERFETDQRIMSISGHNVLQGKRRQNYPYDYYFTRYPIPWGWATWRRAWKHFDFKMSLLEEIKASNFLDDILGSSEYAKKWERIFHTTLSQKVDAWDYRWMYSCWLQNGLSVSPTVNLVSNIGYDEESTHAANSQSPYNSLPTKTLNLPLRHPPYVIRDDWADKFTQESLFDYRPRLTKKILNKLRVMLRT